MGVAFLKSGHPEFTESEAQSGIQYMYTHAAKPIPLQMMEPGFLRDLANLILKRMETKGTPYEEAKNQMLRARMPGESRKARKQRNVCSIALNKMFIEYLSPMQSAKVA